MNLREINTFLGMRGWGKVLFYPFGVFFLTPIQLYKTCKNLLVLSKKPWGSFLRLSTYRSLNSSFHRAYDLFMEKYGRYGFAYELSLGLPLVKNYHYTKLSARLYRHAESVIPWVGVAIAILSQFIWLSNSNNTFHIILVVLIGIFSTLGYFCAFEALKYDSLGWMLVPLGYFCLLTDNLPMFSLVFLGISFLSIPTLIIQGSLWFILSIYLFGPVSILYFAPGVLKFLTHIIYFIKKGLRELDGFLNALGITSQGVKLRRWGFGASAYHFLSLWSLFCGYLLYRQIHLDQGLSPELLISFTALILFWINAGVRRFADVQSLMMLVCFAFSTTAIRIPDHWLMGALWLSLSPLPILMGFADEPYKKDLIWKVPEMGPFPKEATENQISTFFKDLNSPGRVFFDFDHNPTKYIDFGKLRPLKEYMQFYLIKKTISIFPDFLAAYDSFGSDFPLGKLYLDRSPAGQISAMKEIGAQHLLLLNNEPNIPQEYKNAGFQLVSMLDLLGENTWEKIQFDKSKPYLLLLKPDIEISLSQNCELLLLAPNKIQIKILKEEQAHLKFLYSSGWSANNAEVFSTLGETSFPWIGIKGAKGTITELNFNQ
ncbi:MAG: hypothetical protein HN474_07420 [Nitrospina sp.]|nr:hypothetical protein [Nitrospina sp.]